MLYKGKLSKVFLDRAAENAGWISEHGHMRGGFRFYGNREVVFDSDNVDFAAIKEAAERGDLILTPEGEVEEPRRRGRPPKIEE